MPRPETFAVIVNHRDAGETLGLVETLGRHRGLNVLVVDNASGAGEVTRLQSAVEVIESGDNLGYAGGNNVGIRAALERGAEFVWLLNPDTAPRRRALPRMLKAMTGDDEIGIVGATLLEGSNPKTIQSQGGRIVWEAGGRSELISAGERYRRHRSGPPRAVDFTPGASMLVRRSVFEQIGLLPEDYFMYFEETEFCVSASRAGWRVVVPPGAAVVHDSARRSGLPSEVFVYYFVRGRIVFGSRHTSTPVDRMVEDLQPWIESWRRRVEKTDPRWLDRFEHLVTMAIEDGRAGVTGRKAGIP